MFTVIVRLGAIVWQPLVAIAFLLLLIVSAKKVLEPFDPSGGLLNWAVTRNRPSPAPVVDVAVNSGVVYV